MYQVFTQIGRQMRRTLLGGYTKIGQSEDTLLCRLVRPNEVSVISPTKADKAETFIIDGIGFRVLTKD